MKINDKDFRLTDSKRHPYFEPYLVFNDKPGSPTIYFKSCYNDDQFCLKTWGVCASQLHRSNPIRYYYPEKKENEIIEIKQGSFARIPHTFYTAHTRDNSKLNYSVRDENGL